MKQQNIMPNITCEAAERLLNESFDTEYNRILQINRDRGFYRRNEEKTK